MDKVFVRSQILLKFKSVGNFCKVIGLNRSMVLNWLNGSANPSQAYLERILAPIGLKLDITPLGAPQPVVEPVKVAVTDEEIVAYDSGDKEDEGIDLDPIPVDIKDGAEVVGVVEEVVEEVVEKTAKKEKKSKETVKAGE